MVFSFIGDVLKGKNAVTERMGSTTSSKHRTTTHLQTDKLSNSFSNVGEAVVGVWDTFKNGVKAIYSTKDGKGGALVNFAKKTANVGIFVASTLLNAAAAGLKKYPVVGILVGAFGIYKAVDWFNARSKVKAELQHEEQVKEMLDLTETNQRLRTGAAVPNMDSQEVTTKFREGVIASRQPAVEQGHSRP